MIRLWIIKLRVGAMTWYKLNDTWSAVRDNAQLFTDAELPPVGPNAEPWDKEQVA